jgi:uncharacterized protein YeaO (DUF488 family)
MHENEANIDQWCQQVGPSTRLRRWCGYDPARFAEFAARYRDKLASPERASAVAELAGGLHEPAKGLAAKEMPCT